MASSMMAMPGTMGMGIVSFTVMWAIMMAAMMLPSIVPFAAIYTQTFQEDRVLRILALAGGYMIVWTLPGVPIYGLALLTEKAAMAYPNAPAVLAVIIFAACGVYQLTPLKDKCLEHCRSPLAHVFRYAAYTGRVRDLRVGIDHGMFCLGCCWALMLLMLSFGLMNIQAMVVLTAIFMIEKFWSEGPLFGRFIGVVALIAAVAVIIRPELAPWPVM
ncbi:MAG: DUF2182 domain-containing protein [bacterium]|nr:DUF2182 domain-containing protein [bacterium]